NLPFWLQLRWSLIMLMVLLAVLPVIAISAIVLARAYTITGEQIELQLTSVANLKRNELARWLDNSKETLNRSLSVVHEKRLVTDFAKQSVSGVPLTGMPIGQLQVNDLLVDMLGRQLYFDELFIYNPKGEILTASNPVQVGKVVTRQPY